MKGDGARDGRQESLPGSIEGEHEQVQKLRGVYIYKEIERVGKRMGGKRLPGHEPFVHRPFSF